MPTFAARVAGAAVIVLSTGASLAVAQTSDSGLSRAIQALQRTVSADGRQTIVPSGRLFGGLITATITNNDGDPNKIGPSDCIDLIVEPRPGTQSTLPGPQRFRGPRTAAGAAACGGTQGSFEQWTRDETVAGELLRILFPGSLGATVLGRAPGEMSAQQQLLTTVLDTEDVRQQSQGGRAIAGGLAEFEWLRREDRRPGDSGWAWQGLFGITKTLAVQARFARQQEFYTSSATAVSVDYHPFIEIDRNVLWRVGGTARGGFLYSRSNALDIGSLEFGGGGWGSGFKDLGRVRVGGGAMVQGSKSWVPGGIFDASDDLRFLANAINDRGLLYDFTFGGTTSLDTSRRTRVIVKLLENSPLSLRDQRLDSWLLSTGFSYSLGLPTINVGYQRYSNASLHGHSLFFQGNFDW